MWKLTEKAKVRGMGGERRWNGREVGVVWGERVRLRGDFIGSGFGNVLGKYEKEM
jgi:hypothetical protein